MNSASARSERLRVLGYLGTIAVLAIFYAAISYHAHQKFTGRNGGWYGELARAFLQGKVSLLTQPTPELLADPNPYVSNHHYKFAWDISFYHGKYYLYFGPSPTILFFLPWQALTGYVLNQALVLWFICVSQVILFALFLAAVVRIHFPTAPIWSQILILAIYGLGACQGYCIHFVLVYHIASLTASTFVLAMFYCMFLGLHSARRALVWMAMASLCWGIAVATRSTMIFYGVAFLPVFYHLVKGRPLLSMIGNGLCIALPGAIIGLALAWYNQARFGSPVDFGLDYQIAAGNYSREAPFSVRHLLWGVPEILFMPPRPSFDFPFFFPAPPDNKFFNPWGLSGVYIGVLFSVPIVFVSLFWPRLIQDSRLRWFAGLLTFSGGLMFVVLAAYRALYYRYFLDFLTPFFMLMAVCLLAWALRPRQEFRALVLAASAWTLYMGFALSLIGEFNGIHSFQTYPPPKQGELWLPDGETTPPRDQ